MSEYLYFNRNDVKRGKLCKVNNKTFMINKEKNYIVNIEWLSDGITNSMIFTSKERANGLAKEITKYEKVMLEIYMYLNNISIF